MAQGPTSSQQRPYKASIRGQGSEIMFNRAPIDPLALSNANRTVLIVGDGAENVGRRAASVVKASHEHYRYSSFAVIGSTAFKESLCERIGMSASLHYEEPPYDSSGLTVLALTDLVIFEYLAGDSVRKVLKYLVDKGTVDVIGCAVLPTPHLAEGLLQRLPLKRSEGGPIPVISCFSEGQTETWIEDRRPRYEVYWHLKGS
jgi:hypothetical protein